MPATKLAPNVKVTVNTKLETRLTRYLSLSAEIKEREELKKNLSGLILDDAPEGYESDDFKMSPVKGTSAAIISGELLLKLGVSPKLIKKATIPGTDYRYPRITKKQPKTEE